MDRTETCSEGTEQCDKPPSCSVLNRTNSNKYSTINGQPRLKNCTHWNDWKWQMANRICNLEQLLDYFPKLKNQTVLAEVIEKYPLAITPYYASLIRRPDTLDPVFAMCVPQVDELYSPSCLSADPLAENADMPVPGLVHRYPDRSLLIVTSTCASYCRHCTRKRVAGIRECSISTKRFQQMTAYLLAHPEISDVIVSGGDPLIMSTDVLEALLNRLRKIPSVHIIRIGTRTPVVLPQRITDKLTSMLSKYHPLWINTHFNHPNELTDEAARACSRLVDAGIPLGNQSVLLRGINDNPQTIEKLCRGLIQMRVRPYYLFQCDLVEGVEHFRTPLSRGIEIMEYLRGRVSGLAIPAFVVDAPHGGGKIPILPNYVVSTSPTHTVLRNYDGVIVNYPEPLFGTDLDESPKKSESSVGVWELDSGKASAILPLKTSGQLRRRQRITEVKNHNLNKDVELCDEKETASSGSLS